MGFVPQAVGWISKGLITVGIIVVINYFGLNNPVVKIFDSPSLPQDEIEYMNKIFWVNATLFAIKRKHKKWLSVSYLSFVLWV